MLNYKRLVPRAIAASVYAHNNEKITDKEADKINDGSFVEDVTSINGECITAQEVSQKLSQENKHVNYMVGGDDTNELVCYYTWSTDTVEPTSVYIPDLSMIVEDKKLLSYEITPSNADVTSAEFSITSGSDIAHIDGSYVVADTEGSATYKVVINGSIEATANITVSNKPEEFPDDAEHRWIEVEPKTSTIPAVGGTISATGSYGLTGTYGTKKKVGDITDTITVEANTTTEAKTGSKTYYYNNNQFDAPTAEITWTQEARVEQYTYTYEIYIGKSAENIQEKTLSYVWDSTQYGDSNKETIYVKAIKNKVNESGDTVETTVVNWGTRSADSEKFSLNNIQNEYIEVYPVKENSSLTDSISDSIQVYIVEADTNYCTVQLVQTKKGVKVIAGDAVMFTYNWTTGKDLDQATFVNANIPLNNTYYSEEKNYAGYGGYIREPYNNFLYFAGDNTGTGNEYSFIDFKSIAEYLEKHGSDTSTDGNKSIIESLIDDNGVISVECDLYTVWYNRKDSEDITLSYTVYNKDSDDATVTAGDLKFSLTGYTEKESSSSPALCYAEGTEMHYVGAQKTYTLSAKFTYYFNSGVFVFETNDGNVGKWQKGETFGDTIRITPTVTDATVAESNGNITFGATIQNLNLPDDVTISKGSAYVYLCDKSTGEAVNYANGSQNSFVNNTFPLELQGSVTIDEIKSHNTFSDSTITVYPKVYFYTIYDYEQFKQYSAFDAVFGDKSITVQL